MAPAKAETAVDFDGTGAVQAGEVEWQQTIQKTIGQGQQFFAGDQRHRAAVGSGALGGIGTVAVGVFRLGRGIVEGLVLFQRSVIAALPAQLHPAFFQARRDTPCGHFFVAIDMPHEGIDDRDHRLHKTHDGLTQLRAVLHQAHAQPCDTDTHHAQHDADQQVDDHADHNPGNGLRRGACDVGRRQRLEPQRRGTQQQAQHRFIAGQQHGLFDQVGRTVGQCGQLACAGAEFVGVSPGVFQNVAQLAEAIPDSLDRRPAPGQHPVAHGCQ
ncbi:hypothetical protein PS854_05701 [Pseudomonas fluorescens]|uniref:Uncharacterized protein n=1 Tax=Pseudomonas fluorescens TaxID=294 RepID=A0A5E7Q425_PSEFL|nr:hypothetical protein PS854_05701 [Pseudomonas fluorescens]